MRARGQNWTRSIDKQTEINFNEFLTFLTFVIKMRKMTKIRQTLQISHF